MIIEKYELEGQSLPTPHDVRIKGFKYENGYFEISFEDDISRYDSIAYYHPETTKLIMRFYMSYFDVDYYQRTTKGYELVEDFIEKYQPLSQEYLYNYVKYYGLIIMLSDGMLVIDTNKIECIWE